MMRLALGYVGMQGAADTAGRRKPLGDAFRVGLDARTDAGLGFWITRRWPHEAWLATVGGRPADPP